MRLNTGRWGTIKSFDDFMANQGKEPVLEGYTEEEGFEWVIDAIEKCLPTAEKCGVTLGLENHWGLGDRKSTRLNSSHVAISYAVFCLKKKKRNKRKR